MISFKYADVRLRNDLMESQDILIVRRANWHCPSGTLGFKLEGHCNRYG